VYKCTVDRSNEEKMDKLFTSCFSLNFSDPRHGEEMCVKERWFSNFGSAAFFGRNVSRRSLVVEYILYNASVFFKAGPIWRNMIDLYLSAYKSGGYIGRIRTII
jgi:hypothetical protein